jgi:release factor glutamine methyltransferase
MPSEAGASVSELIEGAAARLRAAGVIKPKREAHRLWAWMSRAAPGEAWFARERGAAPAQAAAFEQAIARRAAGEPLCYVLGSAGFRNLELKCDRRALIPRPETEGLVELALSFVRTGRALDLGTGSGCVALAVAQEGAFDEVLGVDLSSQAIALARENATLTGLPVRFVESDLDAALGPEQFDLVISNPPYLTAAEYESLDSSVKAWEPALALASGTDGMIMTRRLIEASRRRLAPGGWLVMELDSSRSGAAAALAMDACLGAVRVWDDLFGRPRYLSVRRGTEE